MNETNHTLKTAERLIRRRFPEYFGESHCFDRIMSSSYRRKAREINYIFVGCWDCDAFRWKSGLVRESRRDLLPTCCIAGGLSPNGRDVI